MHFEFAWGQNRFNSIISKYFIKWRLEIDLSIAWCIKIKWYLGKPCIWLDSKHWLAKKIAKQKNFFFLYNQNHFDINEKGFWIILEYQWIMFFSGYCAQKKVSRSRVIKSSKTFRYLFSLAFEMFPSNLQAAYATSNDVFCWSLCRKIK